MRFRIKLHGFWFLTLCAILQACGGNSSGQQNGTLLPGDLCLTPRAASKTLYIWSGDAARIASDFISVVDFDEASPSYGKVLKMVQVPTNNNEPHHLHLSSDGNLLAAGGLLSLLKGQDDFFFFDVNDARNPKYLHSTSAPTSAVTDEFYPLANGGFLATNMGSKNGDALGRVVEINHLGKIVHEWPDNPPTDGFNPHGISVRPELNLMMTSDFVNPITTITAAKRNMEFRNTIRVWNFEKRSIVKTIVVPGAVGTMDVQLIPFDHQGRAFTVGINDGLIYLVNPVDGTAKAVFNTHSISLNRPTRNPQILQISEDGSRLFLPLGGAGIIAMLNIENPVAPKIVSMIDLGANSGPHMAHLTHDNKRLIVTDYFLDEDNFGQVHFDGDHQVHVIKVNRNGMALDTKFNLDMNAIAASGPARPHGVAEK
ncbi:selenium-binding protein SBP56-related protein [Undibacterium rugosum]|uniref:selenium-binding protein SBP56-related protein n=1 Tax=Undibacterium rugosum TaxID=2762291 RepID=UPI001B837E74|nr:selenium-binding protein SBP56-related protein [Undibacterium rugosum]MBR7780211.1 hypothetical protein [Undibacterium rugosum]